MWIYDISPELEKNMKLYSEKFNDSVPLLQISGRRTEEEIIEAIKKSLENNQKISNYLTEINFFQKNNALT